MPNSKVRRVKGRAYGTKHGSSKLNSVIVADIRKKYRPWKYTMQRLAMEHRVSIRTIEKVIKKINWKFI